MSKRISGIMLAAFIFSLSARLLLTAQPANSHKCKEEGPHESGWIKDSCPGITNEPFVALPDCQEVGSAPKRPNVYPPIYQSGSKHKEYTFDCPENPTTNGPPADITFTVGGVYWNPQLPAKWTKAGSFTHTASVKVTSSDPSLCPSPGWIPVGDPTVFDVHNTNCFVASEDFADSKHWRVQEIGFSGEPVGGGGFEMYDGFTVKFYAEIIAVCIKGCSTSTNSGTKTSDFTDEDINHYIIVHKVGEAGIEVPLPTALAEALGELLASVVGDKIGLYGADSDTINRIAGKIQSNRPYSPSQGVWKDGKAPCCN